MLFYLTFFRGQCTNPMEIGVSFAVNCFDLTVWRFQGTMTRLDLAGDLY